MTYCVARDLFICFARGFHFCFCLCHFVLTYVVSVRGLLIPFILFFWFFSLMIWHCFGSPKYRADYMQRQSVSSAPANVTENLWYLFIFNRNIRFITQGLGIHWWGCFMALCQLFGLVVRCTPSYR